jgi:NAD(P)-dependent dehydrogenase (short-subunit alcohol dehydrogenase family)
VDLSGRVACITGAAGGIGAATTRRLAALGATVVGVDIADQRGAELFATLGPPHRYCHLDVTDASAWTAIAASIVSDLGGLDIVHLNAGVMLRPPGASGLDDPLRWLTPERYRRVMSVNADGVVFGVVATVPHLERRGGGDLIITSSMAGLSPLELDPAYSMSKHALIGLTRSLAPVLLRRGVRLNAICPAGVDTPIVPPDVKASTPRWSPPSLVADVVVDVLAGGGAGEIWTAISDDPGGVWRHEFAPVRRGEPAQSAGRAE